VPASWRAALPAQLRLIDGSYSWARTPLTIEIARSHASLTDAYLRVIIAHEFGHLIAFHYGSRQPLGSAPAGWPAYSGNPLEAWADCVSRAFTGVDEPSHGLPSCGGLSLSWTVNWLALGPTAHAITQRY
jgi:hypothetical protein